MSEDRAPLSSDDIARLPYRPCVGVMLVNAAGRVFVGQRRDRDTAAWQMPQGGIDEGESRETAVLRELREETGIGPELVQIEAWTRAPVHYDLPVDVIPTIWKGRYRGQMQHWALARFLGTESDIDIETDHPEFSQWRWADPKELVPGIVSFKRDVYARVVDEFGDLL